MEPAVIRYTDELWTLEIQVWCMFKSFLSLLRTEEWLVPLPWTTSPGWLASLHWFETWVLPTSAKRTISEHCSEAQNLASGFLGPGTWVSVALIWMHMNNWACSCAIIKMPKHFESSVSETKHGLAAYLIAGQFAFQLMLGNIGFSCLRRLHCLQSCSASAQNFRRYEKPVPVNGPLHWDSPAPS